MELGWTAEAYPGATKLLEECGFTVTASASAPITVSGGPGSGWEVTSASGTQSCGTIAETMSHITEDLLQGALPNGDGTGSAPDVDTFEGCMVGIAVGDMVGLGVEGFPMPPCKAYTTKIRQDLTQVRALEQGLTQLYSRVFIRLKLQFSGFLALVKF